MSFAFHIEVAIGVGKPDDAATADAEPNQAVTGQRVNVDPKCEFALYRRPPPRRPLPYPPISQTPTGLVIDRGRIAVADRALR
jgi:hypothetical protein